MLSLFLKSKPTAQGIENSPNRDTTAKMIAIDKSLATIEFTPDGKIITANANFLNAVGYQLQDIQGQHHSIFVDEKTKKSDVYRQFWARLNNGEFIQNEFKRVGKQGNDIWIQATYNPLLDEHNRVYKVIKFATDITAQKLIQADYSGQISAIHKSLAVIEFDTRGNILTANNNFLSAMGYRLDEIKGKHHRLFVSDDYAKSTEYSAFWQSLSEGNFESGEFMRLNKGGARFGFKPPTTPSWTLTAKPLKLLSMHQTLPSKL